MVKRTKTANDKSRPSSPARPLKRPKPTENASQGSVRTGSPKASTSFFPSRRSDSSKLTPTRSSTRKCRSTAKVAVVEDSSDSDCTPPPSIISKSPIKKRITEKRVPRSEEEPTEPDVIDLTVPQTLSPKSPRKRPKTDRRLPVNPDTFINLCSDEEMNPQPRKKRKVPPADEVIFISSGDEAELPGTQFVQRTTPSLEHAAEVQVPKEGYAEYSAASADPVAPDTSHEIEMYHNHPEMTTPPPIFPLENDSPESMIVNVTTGQDMTGIEEGSTPRLSRERLNALHQESLQNVSVKSLMSEESCSASFCNTPGPEPKQQIHKVVLKQAKRALLTSLIFARPMTSLGGTSRPRANVNLQCPNSSKPVTPLESSVAEMTSLHQGDTAALDFPKVVLDTPTPPTFSFPSSTNALRSADSPVKAATPENFPDTTTCEDICISSASPLMGVDEVEVEPVFSVQVKAADDCSSVVPASCTGETFAKDVPSLEIVMGENAMVKEHDTFPREGQADDRPAESGFIEAEPNLNTGPVNADKFLDTTTCEEIRASFASPLMEVDETGAEPVFSAQVKATDNHSKDAVPVSCMGGSSPKDVPSLEIVVKENAMMVKARDTSIPREGQADDHPAETGFTEAEPMQNSQQLPSGVAEGVSRTSNDIERAGDTPEHPYATTIDDTHHETPPQAAVQADDPIVHPTFRDTHHPSRDPYSHELIDASNNLNESLGNSLPRETSPILQSYINSSIFELEHSPNLTFQILFTSNKILDDIGDLAISLPCYPERLRY